MQKDELVRWLLGWPIFAYSHDHWLNADYGKAD